MGTTPDYAPMRASVPVLGRFFNREESQKRSRVAVVGQTVARELFGENNPIGEMIKVNKINFQIIGLLPEKGANTWRDQDDLIVIPIQTAMRRVLGKDFVDSMDIEIQDSESMEQAQTDIRELVTRSHRIPPSQKDSFDIRNLAEIQAALSETSRTMAWLLGGIAAVSLLVGGIGIMNIMLVSVTERTREIGLRKALGAKRFDILAQFLIEAVVVSVAGGMVGIILGGGISAGLSYFAGWTTRVSPQSIILAALFSTAVGVGFGFWPARKAAKLNPIDALRYE
ncbi:MAG: ABC transporter permease [Elusimicrobia bacterium]|nr:ABC transporter permease [Elusimicrobiota bacterium]